MAGSLYFVRLSGNSRQRGLQHGRLLREPIQTAIDFYRELFRRHLGIDSAEIRRRSARFIEPTDRTSPELLAEYEGIAEGSGQTLEDIFSLSGRYEITYESIRLGECSNVFVGPQCMAHGHTLLGQNWEWRPEVMGFRAVLIARCDDLPDHLMVTECGQPGKYGLNEHGLGVAETGLSCASQRSVGDNLFVVVMRKMLACRDLDQARQTVHRYPPEATISFFAADSRGHGFNLEALPSGIVEREFSEDEIDWHTNHSRLTEEPCLFGDSLIRGRRWEELIDAARPVTVPLVGRWLADSANGYNSICRAPDPERAQTPTFLQTLCSIVLDLTTREMWISDGLSSQMPYQRVGFDEEERRSSFLAFDHEDMTPTRPDHTPQRAPMD